MYEIYCQEFCNRSKRTKNVVCSIPNIKEFAIRDCKGNIDIYYKMLGDVYRQLEFDKYLSFDYRSLLIEKELVKSLSIKELEKIEYAGKMPDYFYAFYYTDIENEKYILRIKSDGKVYYKKQKDFNNKRVNWKYLMLIPM